MPSQPTSRAYKVDSSALRDRLLYALAVVTLVAAVCGCSRLPALSAEELESPDRIEHLAPNAAAELVAHIRDLHDGAVILRLDGLRTIPKASAAVLASSLPENACLCLDGVSTLPEDVAKEIASTSCHYLSLNRLEDVSDDVARVLASYRGGQYGSDLHLDGTKTLSLDGIAHLATSSARGLSLNGLSALTAEQARALAKFQGHVLSLDGVKSLSPEAASELAGYRGSMLSLGGLESISAEVAEALARFQGEALWLTRLRDPSEQVVNALRSSGASVSTPLGELGEPRNASDSR